jgi:hypothetical protein
MGSPCNARKAANVKLVRIKAQTQDRRLLTPNPVTRTRYASLSTLSSAAVGTTGIVSCRMVCGIKFKES